MTHVGDRIQNVVLEGFLEAIDNVAFDHAGSHKDGGNEGEFDLESGMRTIREYVECHHIKKIQKIARENLGIIVHTKRVVTAKPRTTRRGMRATPLRKDW
jgi:hypothetical protein